MTFKATKPSELLESLLLDEGPFLSMYLPFGIPGQSDERLRIDRKNLITEAKKKLEKASDDHWCSLLADIEHAVEGASRETKPMGRPCTEVYIASKTQSLKSVLPNALRPHFSFAAFAEIEPLVYFRWANDPYRIFVIELDGPKIFQGVGLQMQEMGIKVPMGLAGTFGDSIEDYRFKSIIENPNRANRVGRGHNENGHNQTDQLGFVSFSDQTGDHEGNLNYWLGIISELFRAGLERELDGKTMTNFVLGDGDLCRRFVELNPQLHITQDQMIATRYKGDEREFIQQVLHKIVEKKLAASASEFDGSRCHDNVNEIVDLLEARQIRKLFVQQDDWFSDESANNGQYEVSNPRSSILADALKCRAQVVYTKNRIDNKHGLAGLSYKGSDYLWNSQKNS